MTFVTKICPLPVTVEPSPVAAKVATAPAERVRLVTVSAAALLVVAAGGVTVKVFEPCRSDTPLPVDPIVTAELT